MISTQKLASERKIVVKHRLINALRNEFEAYVANNA
jgi:hypothetical protein